MVSFARQAEALASGGWVTAHGRHIVLRTMNDSHLINALLKSLADKAPEDVVQPLAREVSRRGLRGAAMTEAERRKA